MTPLKRVAVLATASIAAVALAACGQEADTARESSKLAMLASDITGSLNRTVETTSKADSVAVRMTGTAAKEKVDVRGAIALKDPIKAEFTVTDGDDDPSNVRLIGTAIYVQVPQAERASMDGKSWLKMDLGKMGANTDAMARQFDDMDPVKGVKTLLSGKNVSVVGEETVNGVRTVHYTTTAPVDSYLGQLDAEARKGVSDQLTKAGVTEVKTDVWVDEQYQPRRVAMVMGSLSDFTVDYTDYGKPVSVEAPPAGETADFAEMLDQLKDLKLGS